MWEKPPSARTQSRKRAEEERPVRRLPAAGPLHRSLRERSRWVGKASPGEISAAMISLPLRGKKDETKHLI